MGNRGRFSKSIGRHGLEGKVGFTCDADVMLGVTRDKRSTANLVNSTRLNDWQ